MLKNLADISSKNVSFFWTAILSKRILFGFKESRKKNSSPNGRAIKREGVKGRAIFHIKGTLSVHSFNEDYLFLSAKVAMGTFFMKSQEPCPLFGYINYKWYF